MAEFPINQWERLSGTGECPECFAEVEVVDSVQNEIVQCPECGTDLEILRFERQGNEATPIFDLAPKIQEDYGE